MRRDIELIRILLLELEGVEIVDLSRYSSDQLNYHRALLREGGLAEGIINYPTSHQTDIPDLAILQRLTWDGHEFLGNARSEKTWNKAKSLVADKGLAFSIEALKIALGQAVRMLMN